VRHWRSDIQSTGADVVMNMYFDCNLDRGVDRCAPHLPFEVLRLDTPDSSLSRGYNVRYISAVTQRPPPRPDVFFDDDADVRTVVKAGGALRTRTHSTDAVFRRAESARVCMSIDRQGESCSDLGRVLVVNDPPARHSARGSAFRSRAAGAAGTSWRGGAG
jgi:hypothetical protein